MTLCAVGLGRRFGAREVVRDLSLTVSPGELVGLLGPNGAGKTTTFRMLAGLLKPTHGRVRLGAQDITDWPLWRRARAGLGYLPQGASVFRRLTVRENIAAGLARLGLKAEEEAQEQARLLELMGLQTVADARGERLSGGERRRVEIARALAARPEILLVDEPFAGLDPLGSCGVVTYLKTLCAKGVGVLLTDHDTRQSLDACDRVYILAAGELLLAGEPSVVVRDPRVQAEYLGAGFGERWPSGAP